MSGRIVGEILNNAPTDLTPAQMLVLVALAEDARDTGTHARTATHSSLINLHHRTRLAPGSIKNVLAALTQRGLIKPMHRGQIGTVQHYKLTELYEYHRDAVAGSKAAGE